MNAKRISLTLFALLLLNTHPYLQASFNPPLNYHNNGNVRYSCPAIDEEKDDEKREYIEPIQNKNLSEKRGVFYEMKGILFKKKLCPEEEHMELCEMLNLYKKLSSLFLKKKGYKKTSMHQEDEKKIKNRISNKKFFVSESIQKDREIDLYYYKSIYSVHKGNYEDAFDNAIESLRIMFDDKGKNLSKIDKCCGNLGMIYQYNKETLESLIKLPLKNKRSPLELKPCLLAAYTSLESAYYGKGNYHKIIECHEYILELSAEDRVKNHLNDVFLLKKLSDVYCNNGKINEAIECHKRIREICTLDGSKGIDDLMADYKYSVGMIYQKIGKKELAAQNLEWAAKKKNKLVNRYRELALDHYRKRKIDKAIECLERAEKIMKEIPKVNRLDLAKLYGALIICCSKTGDCDKFRDNYKKSLKIKFEEGLGINNLETKKICKKLMAIQK